MNKKVEQALKSSVLVVAHPDDEILWFSSVFNKVDAIIICFGNYLPDPILSKGREKVIAEYPLSTLSTLGIVESESFDQADWSKPEVTSYGLRIVKSKKSAQRYENTFGILHDQLESRLSSFDNIFVHNPWGEYGHEDHVQVYRCVADIARRQGQDVWFSNYCSAASWNLAQNYLTTYENNGFTLPTQYDTVKSIVKLYKKHACWTWYDDYEWFPSESYIRANGVIDASRHGHIFSLNMMKTNFHRKRKPKGKIMRFRQKVANFIEPA